METMLSRMIRDSIRRYREMSCREKGLRGVLFLIGYILSPLSWWNDAVVNIPLSYVIASLLAIVFGDNWFPLLFVSAYMFTNVLGFLFMHIAVVRVRRLGARELVVDTGFALFYTVLIYCLAVLGIIPPLFQP